MKYVKMQGLAAVAAAALMAFVGASTASATVLCKTNPVAKETGRTCPSGWAYPAEAEIHGISEGNLALTTNSEFTEFTCKKGTIVGDTENEGSATETVRGKATQTTWSECSTPSGACTLITVKPGTFEMHWIKGTHSGTLTFNGTEITQSCTSIFGAIHCIFVFGNEDIGTITGGNPATIDLESTPINVIATSGLCPSGPKMDAKYEITTPTPLYVANET